MKIFGSLGLRESINQHHATVQWGTNSGTKLNRYAWMGGHYHLILGIDFGWSDSHCQACIGWSQFSTPIKIC
jgi:hypothetical protein